VEQLKYLGTILMYLNSIQEKIKSRLKSEKACYHPVLNLLSSSLLSKYIKIKAYSTIILPVVMYGCESWSFTLREEHRLMASEDRVRRRKKLTAEWRRLYNEEPDDVYLHRILFRLSNQDE
jgi:hypothetical protein